MARIVSEPLFLRVRDARVSCVHRVRDARVSFEDFQATPARDRHRLEATDGMATAKKAATGTAVEKDGEHETNQGRANKYVEGCVLLE